MSTTTELDQETLAAMRAVLERQLLEKAATLLGTRDFEDVVEAYQLARLLASTVGFSGWPPIAGVHLPEGPDLEVLIRAARWEDELGDDAADNNMRPDDPEYDPEDVAFHRRRAENGRKVLAYLNAERGNPRDFEAAEVER